MNRKHIIIPIFFLLLVISCSKGLKEPAAQKERELSVPEKVEKEIMEVLSKDWKALSDTLNYFDSTMLSKGISEGVAPDGVHYELAVREKSASCVEADFIVEDSTWAAINGKIDPLSICLSAFDTEIAIQKEARDSSSLSVSTIKVIAPALFILGGDHQASLLFEGRRVGYLTWDGFENTDYSTGTYIVAHYYDDPRTFAIYDKGIVNLLKLNLTDVIK